MALPPTLTESPVWSNMQLRHSCRAFKSNAVDDLLLEAILKAGQSAPSACNLQPYCFHVVTGESLMRLNEIRPWYGAPVIILGCYVDRQGWVRNCDQLNFRQFDLALAMGQMALRAQDLGLDSCFIGSFVPPKITQALNLPSEHLPEIALAIGYSAQGQQNQESTITPKQRKSLKDLVTFHH